MRIALAVVLIISLLPIPVLAQVSHPAEDILPGSFPATGNFRFLGTVYFGDLSAGILPASAAAPRLAITDQTGTPVLYLRDGKVGIGTSNPQNALHVAGHITADFGTADFVQLWAHNSIIFGRGGTIGGLRIGSATNLAAAGYQEHMRISDNGNVGIGTTSPSQRLDVAGNVRASDVIGSRLCIGGDCKTSWSSITPTMEIRAGPTSVSGTGSIAVNIPNLCLTNGCEVFILRRNSDGKIDSIGVAGGYYKQNSDGNWFASTAHYCGGGGVSTKSGRNGDTTQTHITMSAISQFCTPIDCLLSDDYGVSGGETSSSQWTLTDSHSSYSCELWVQA